MFINPSVTFSPRWNVVANPSCTDVLFVSALRYSCCEVTRNNIDEQYNTKPAPELLAPVVFGANYLEHRVRGERNKSVHFNKINIPHQSFQGLVTCQKITNKSYHNPDMHFYNAVIKTLSIKLCWCILQTACNTVVLHKFFYYYYLYCIYKTEHKWA